MASSGASAHVTVANSPAHMSASVCAYVCDAVDAAVADHGAFLIALSGGSLPKLLAAALSAGVEAGRDLHWAAWHVYYVDERVVPLNHPDSNHDACDKAIYSQARASGAHAARPPCAPHVHQSSPACSPGAASRPQTYTRLTRTHTHTHTRAQRDMRRR